MSKIMNLIMKKGILYIIGMLFFMVSGLLLMPGKEVFAHENTVYSDGVYRYLIIDEVENKVKLIGIDKTENTDELYIPGKAVINEKEYTVSLVDFDYEYYANENYAGFYKSVKKLNIADDFTGILNDPEYAFPNLNTVEFYGKETPEKVRIYMPNRNIKDFLFIVPKGTESAYEKVIEFSINYSIVSDLYEYDIELTPTIVSDNAKHIEYSYFAIDGFIYKVIESAKNGVGKVRLVGITGRQKKDYLELPDKVCYNGYSYSLTSLRKYSLIGSEARVVVVPDTVTDMESCVFDQDVELLFLSKNCKVIPSALITNTYEDGVYTNIRFVYVPEGVTTLSDYAFACTPTNTSSIILPSTIKKVGKESLYTFKLVTFLNKKPLNNVASAIDKGTTVKVNESAIKTFKKVLGNKISVVAAKNIVKTKDLTVNKEIKISTIKTATIKATLTKGSNETIYWLSANPDIVEVSSKGVITPKKAGTAYVVAYTRTSGKHKAVKVTVTETTFNNGIFTYRITDPSKKTVTLCEVRPDASVKTLTIPETVTYKNVKYTVTDVVANPDNTSIPLIPEKYSDNKIKKITFPKSIKGKVGYLGVLKSIESITFKGNSAPETIKDWHLDGGILAWQAVIYVPQGRINSYMSSIELSYEIESYQESHYGCYMDYNFAEIGKDQVMRFVVDGILYRVTKYAGKKNGKVAVKGMDLNLKKVDIKSTVTYNGYTYNVTEVYVGAIKYGNDREVNIDKSIKRNTKEKYTAPVY